MSEVPLYRCLKSISAFQSGGPGLFSASKLGDLCHGSSMSANTKSLSTQVRCEAFLRRARI